MNITLEGDLQMNDRTIKQQLNEYLVRGVINFYQLQCIEREIGTNKLMKDLTPSEKELLLSYTKVK
jgi:hypothetical protein